MHGGDQHGLPRVHLPVFEGPLDLLLHLCQQNEVPITQIPIALITARYLEAIELMRRLDLEVAGEFLAMAATLCYLKSRELLPRTAEPVQDEVDGDPRQELILRLLEYRKYKEAARDLAHRPVLDRDVFHRPEGAEAREHVGPAPIEASMFGLLEALRQMLVERARPPREHLVHLEAVSLPDAMRALFRGLRAAGGSATLRALVAGSPSLGHLLAGFLGLLEMCRLRLLAVVQPDPWGDIEVHLRWQGTEDQLPLPDGPSPRRGPKAPHFEALA